MILLEKYFEDMLKEHNLSDIIINRIKMGGGLFNLTTPCGKPIIFVKGIKIPHTKLSKVERDYLIDVLSIFVEKNLDKIKKSVKIVTNPIKLKDYGYNVYFKYEDNYRSEKITGSVVEIRNGKNNDFKSFSVINNHNKITIDCKNLTKKELNNYMSEKMDEMIRVSTEIIVTQKKIINQRKFQSKLLSCND